MRSARRRECSHTRSLPHSQPPRRVRPWLSLDLVDLPPPKLHEVVVSLRDVVELLCGFWTQSLALHHLLEGLHARHFELGHQRPIPLGAEIRHDSHLAHAQFLVELRHREELLYHRTYF